MAQAPSKRREPARGPRPAPAPASRPHRQAKRDRGADTREQLIQAALEVFGRLGFEGASTREIAKAAGANLAAIVYHFGGKEGLHIAVAEYIVGRINGLVGPALAGMAAPQATASPESARRALEMVIGTMIDVMLGEAEAERWARFIVREQMQPTAAFDVIYGFMGTAHGLASRLVATALGRKEDEEVQGAGLHAARPGAGLQGGADARLPAPRMEGHRRGAARKDQAARYDKHRGDPRGSAVMRRRIIIIVLVVAALGGLSWWWFGHSTATDGALTLYGNVDLRQVDLAFTDSGRIDAVLTEEGARVKAGEVVARLDTSRLKSQVAAAQAQVDAASAALAKLKSGSRPEEIAQARANLAAATANAANAQSTYQRLTKLNTGGAAASATQSQVDGARAAKDAADAQMEVAQQSLALALAGPRKEDIAQAVAQLDGAQAQLSLLNQQLADADLKSPVDGHRALAPAGSGRNRFAAAAGLLDRRDRSEVGAGLRLRSGPAADPRRHGRDRRRRRRPRPPLTGHVGFISPVAEFTPRAVQTEELRTSLVYEVRIVVDDPNDTLKLGQPATVNLTGEPRAGGAMNQPGPAIFGRDIRKAFKRGNGATANALDGVSLTVEHGGLTALVGPDGAGKTTLIRLIAGLMVADGGELNVLGIDIAKDPQAVQDRVGYMPQKFGLYEDLTVQENMDLYADLHGVTREERAAVYPQLMEMTNLGPFKKRLAGKLSGGMKQKLGLACTLVRAPDLLLLDEPTVGVDPLSRRELWEIILHLVNDRGLTVLLATSYLDEAERCKHAVVLHEGTVLAQGAPETVTRVAAERTFVTTPTQGEPARVLQARLLDDPNVVDAVPQGGKVRLVKAEGGTLGKLDASPVRPRFEDGFMILLRQAAEARRAGDAGAGRGT